VTETDRERSYPSALALLTLLFFMWGFITVLNDILIPHLKGVFELDNAGAMMVQFAFFGAYFALALPAGALIERVGYRGGIVVGLVVTGLGALAFWPAAAAPSYPLFLGALFVLAGGITILQVAANPYVAVLGPPRTAASRLNLTQGLNSLGTTVGPLLGAMLILSDDASISAAERARSVQAPYVGIAITLFVLAFVFYRVRLPGIEPRARLGGGSSLWSHRPLVFGTIAIFLYVGAEVGIGSMLVLFFGTEEVASMPEKAAGELVAFYWGAAMVGRFLGAAAQQRVDAARVLAAAAALALVLVVATIAMLGPMSVYTLLAVGLANSVMFPTIFTLAIDGLGPRTSRGSGVLVMAIVGGAVLPVAMGAIADAASYASALWLPAACYLFIGWYALRGHR
jgi:FHS family L-fucose permease-like MFS transporter